MIDAAMHGSIFGFGKDEPGRRLSHEEPLEPFVIELKKITVPSGGLLVYQVSQACIEFNGLRSCIEDSQGVCIPDQRHLPWQQSADLRHMGYHGKESNTI